MELCNWDGKALRIKSLLFINNIITAKEKNLEAMNWAKTFLGWSCAGTIYLPPKPE